MKCKALMAYTKFCILTSWFNFLSSFAVEDIFRQNFGDQMEIGLSDKGYKNVQLKCGTDYMVVDLETEDEFLGVIYTRGSFDDRDSLCFYDTGNIKGQRSFQLKFPFNKCKTKRDGNVYSNILVLQHDKELIMPGDAAFILECDFSRPRDITIRADLYDHKSVKSRITLADADPSTKPYNGEKIPSIESYTNSVIYTPHVLNQRKEEL